MDFDSKVAFVVENLQTALAFEDVDAGVVLVGGGYSVTELAALPWLREIPVGYWGDIDAAGFQILSGLRAHLSHVESCLMDEATLVAHRALWSKDPSPPRVEVLPALTGAEAGVHHGLVHSRWGFGVRLEQERIPWSYAWTALIQWRSARAATAIA